MRPVPQARPKHLPHLAVVAAQRWRQVRLRAVRHHWEQQVADRPSRGVLAGWPCSPGRRHWKRRWRKEEGRMARYWRLESGQARAARRRPPWPRVHRAPCPSELRKARSGGGPKTRQQPISGPSHPLLLTFNPMSRWCGTSKAAREGGQASAGMVSVGAGAGAGAGAEVGACWATV